MGASRKEIARRIKELFLQLNMTQAEFARRLGVSEPQVSQVLSGKLGTSSSFLAKLRSEFGWDLNHIISGDSSVDPRPVAIAFGLAAGSDTDVAGDDRQAADAVKLLIEKMGVRLDLVRPSRQAAKAIQSGMSVGPFTLLPIIHAASCEWPPAMCKPEDIQKLQVLGEGLVRDSSFASCMCMPDDSMTPAYQKGDVLVIDHSFKNPKELLGQPVVAKPSDGSDAVVGNLMKVGQHVVVQNSYNRGSPLRLGRRNSLLGKVVAIAGCRWADGRPME